MHHAVGSSSSKWRRIAPGLVCQNDFCGVSMGFKKEFYRVPTVFLPDSYGIPLAFLWDIHGMSMVFLWGYFRIAIESKLNSIETRLKPI